ncbi:MAG TPA: hypothetical protein VFZ20_20550 [Longimicrobium sp.]|nr:hypothetical protein [Longimicrobium sp.]
MRISRLPLSVLIAFCGGCTAAPRPETAPAPQPSSTVITAADTVRIEQPHADPAWLSDTVAFGTAVLEDGAPAAGADVYVALADGVPGEPGDCGAPGGLRGLVRTTADAEGRWRTRIPRAERGRPGCLSITAEIRDTTGPVYDRVLAVGGVDLDSMPVRVALQAVPPPDRDPPWLTDPRPDWQWPRVAEHIPGWAGWINGSGPCSAIVSLRDMRQQEAARAYVQEVLAASGYPGDPGCQRFDITFRQVDYGWADLARWSGRSALLFQFRGVEMFDVDEVENRLVYRFREPSGARAARRALPALRVPPGAIQVLEREDDEFTPDFGPEAPLLGRALGDGVVTPWAVWSGDGREVLYLGEDSLGHVVVRATDVATRRVRDLVRTTTGDGMGLDRLRRASSGVLYADLELPDAPGIARLRPGTDAAPELILPAPFSRFDMDSAERRFVYRRAFRNGEYEDEELALWDARTGRRRTVVSLSGVYTWWMEPGGRAVAYTVADYEHPANAGVWTYDVASGRQRQLWRAPEDETEGVSAVRWVNGAPRLLLARRPAGAAASELTELDPATGRRTRLGSVPAFGGTRPAGAGAWSPDGRRAAVWVTVATDPPDCITGVCASGGMMRSHMRLYLLEAGQEARMIAEFVEHVQEDSWEAAFSPDGKRLLYPADGRIYVQDLP